MTTTEQTEIREAMLSAVDYLNDSDAEKVVNAYVENMGKEYANADELSETFSGIYDSELDHAIQLADDCDIVPKDGPGRNYFDYESFARDLFMDDYYSIDISSNRVAVFRNC